VLIPHNDSLLPRVYNAPRNLSQAPEPTDRYRNSQHIVFKRKHTFQRSYVPTSIFDTDTNIYNRTNKVEPLGNNLVGMYVDTYA
jgi:hypothetical protein